LETLMTVKAIRKVPFESLIFDAEVNCRKDYEEIEELAGSIEREGLLQPIGVTEKKGSKEEKEYFLVWGFRRYLAISKIREKLGEDAFSELDVVITEGTVQQHRERNLIENIDRKSLKPYEIASAIEAMINAGIEQRDIATRLGRPQSWVSYHHKAATKLGVEAKKAFQEGEITLEQALHIADVPEEEQNEVVEAVVSAQTRKEAREIAKNASKEKGARRTYSNKGRPTAKNLTQYVEDASFDSTGGSNKADAAFWNGVAAGIRVALGDAEYDKLQSNEDYTDTSFSSKNKEKSKKQSKTKKSKKEQSTTA